MCVLQRVVVCLVDVATDTREEGERVVSWTTYGPVLDDPFPPPPLFTPGPVA